MVLALYRGYVVEDHMKNGCPWIYAIAALALVVPAIHAVAQSSDDDAADNRLTAKIGMFRPSGSLLRSGSSLWKTFGVDYALKQDDQGNARTVVGFGYAATSGNRFKANDASLSYTRIWRKSSTATGGLYCGAGAGLHITREELTPAFLSPGSRESGMEPGLTFLAGYNLGENWFAEMRYTKVGELAKDVDFSGLTFSLGARRLF